ncbi:hypothetical protein P775_07675 [Puniceibacterium antarcticum]|uniref:Uncharacterized protein n=1 Tax=Puniceibacterium antarcticum TaxID=1206336 RepID=A0A2G8RGV8_9RHOB|nr:hypothetical protein P775_07675 [Puniceibacterium antarcticum]
MVQNGTAGAGSWCRPTKSDHLDLERQSTWGMSVYRLSTVLRDHLELGEVTRITLRQSIGGVRRHLWDEKQRRPVTFAEAKAA